MNNRIRRSLIALTPFALAHAALAEVSVTGAAADTASLAEELTKCTGGAKVEVDGGKLKIADGGNAYAGLLRDMITGATKISADVVNKDPTVFVGAFDPPTRTEAEACANTSSGVQKIDIDDVKKIKDITKPLKLPFAPTPWGALIHELTEAYCSRKDALVFKDAHKKGIDAENVSYALEGTGTQRQQDSFTVPPKPAVPKGGGWQIFTPSFNAALGGPGYWVWDWEVTGGFGNFTPFTMGYFGIEELGADGLIFEGSIIEPTSIDWQPVPAPGTASLALLALASLSARRRRA